MSVGELRPYGARAGHAGNGRTDRYGKMVVKADTVKTDDEPATAPSAPQSGQSLTSKARTRRRQIVNALHACVLENGYAATNLAAIALRCGLSTSHILYYYQTKDAILADLCSQVARKIQRGVIANRDDPPEERIHVLVDNAFAKVLIHKGNFRLFQEFNVISAHNPEIRELLRALSDEMHEYLVDLFSRVPRQPGMSAEDAAEIASAVWMGLLNASGLIGRLEAKQARRLLRRTLLSLANLPPVLSEQI